MSEARLFQTGPGPQVRVARCDGKLVVRGAGESQVQAQGRAVTGEESAKGVTISSQDDLTLQVPVDASLVLQTVRQDLIVKNVSGHIVVENGEADAVFRLCGDLEVKRLGGDLSVKNLDGPLQLGQIEGDASIRHVSRLAAERIQGDLAARYVDGPITIGHVEGDLRLGPVEGDVAATQVQGDVSLRQISGGARIEKAQGDIRLFGQIGPGKHHCHAQGDIIVRWPAAAPVKILASAPSIRSRLRADRVEEGEGQLTAIIGLEEPDSILVLEAAGRILLKERDLVDEEWVKGEVGDDEFSFHFDFGHLANLGSEISARINERMGELERKLGVKMAARVEKQINRAARKAEMAAEKARRQAERAQRRSERHHSASPPPPPKQPARDTSQEQLEVLKMLEKGIISAEEANRLLEALG